MKRLRLFLFVLLALFYFFWKSEDLFIPDAGQPPQFYATQCDDLFSPLVSKVIAQAQKSIHLVVYTLSDPDVIKRLEERAKAGIQVKVILDKSSHPKLHGIRAKHIDLSGLMHRKILIVDDETVLIGSANFTSESLRIDDNFAAVFASSQLATAIKTMNVAHFWMGGQRISFYPLPEEAPSALNQVISLLDNAEESIQVAMFTLTHPLLLDKLVAAHRRGVSVHVVVDRKSADGASKNGVEQLCNAGVPISLSLGSQLFHHKLALIDGEKLIFGSANWTRAAFSKNEECLMIVDNLNEDQIAKLTSLWHAIECMSQEKKCLPSTSRSSISEKSLQSLLEKIIPMIR